MSDLSSSSALAVSSITSGGRNGNYAFLVHSQETLPNSLPYEMNDKPLARQKRRRTSPEDQALLEAEYLLDCKPDKAARMAIVSRVALGEKEVQIWFQNRRQTTRRKSKPLLPHESSFLSSFDSSVSEDVSSSSRAGDRTSPLAGENTSLTSASLQSSSQGFGKDYLDMSSRTRHNELDDTRGNKATQAYDHNSNRILEHHTRRSEGANLKPSEFPRATYANSTTGLHISLEGKAQVISGDRVHSGELRENGSSEIVVKPAQGVKRTLQRSQSTSTISSNITGRASIGRSWDARTWEFFCEKNKVDALDAMATLERSGSAAGAISLIRSRSNQALNPIPQRRNAQSRAGPVKRARAQGGEKPGLVRAISSVARLQTNGQKGSEKVGGSSWKDDSDKENWLPGTELAPASQHRTFENLKEELLRENRSTVTSGRDLGIDIKSRSDKRYKRQKSSQILIFEDEPATATQDTPKLTTGRVEDLDCVQNLLSLSQGNWR